MFEPVLTCGIGSLDLRDIHVYQAQGGYEALRRAVHHMSPYAVAEEVTRAGLRGRGGAGFPTGRKWGFLPKDGRPRYLVCNADESEPGTFSNRLLLEHNPHQLIEGMLLAAYAIRATRSFIYLRGEMRHGHRVLTEALRQAQDHGFLGSHILGSEFSQEITLHRGAGAYICGEEVALLNSLAGWRGEPRLRPPFPASTGLYGMPTIVNNVETLSNVPHIIRWGAEWYRTMGTEKSPGPKIFSVSGPVRRPGNYELPLGTTLREVIEGAAGGLLPGGQLKAVQPGGASSALLTADSLDVPMDFESVAAAGSSLGTAGVMVYDDSVCLVDAAWVLARFYNDESCGQCTPCRIGTRRILEILDRLRQGEGGEDDVEALARLGDTVQATSLCGLGQTAAAMVLSAVRQFPREFAAHVRYQTCPAGACAALGRQPEAGGCDA